MNYLYRYLIWFLDTPLIVQFIAVSLLFLWLYHFWPRMIKFFGFIIPPTFRNKISRVNQIIETWETLKENWGKNLKNVKKDIKIIKNDILSLKKDVLFLKNPNPTGAGSPIQLTSIGEEIAEKLDLESLAKKYFEKLPIIYENANAYEIQTKCFSFAEGTGDKDLFSLLTNDEKNKIEQEAFNRGFDKKAILRILGVLFRNKILSDRNYSLPQIDADDPNK